MPKPMPMDDESHEAFMDRCMSNSVMMEEHEDSDKRSSACEVQWDDSGKSARRLSRGVKHFLVPAQFKAMGDEGKFSGYASIFENVDLGGDVIRKGAFKEFVTNDAGQVKVLFQHDSGGMFSGISGGLPIGLATVEQNTKGLKFEGKLVMDDPFVHRVHAHMKAGTLDGMSIGYDTLPGGAKILESGIRELTAIKLWEISAVTFGMNPKARIDAV